MSTFVGIQVDTESDGQSVDNDTIVVTIRIQCASPYVAQRMAYEMQQNANKLADLIDAEILKDEEIPF